MQKYKPYKKNFDHSYSIGIFPTIELLTHRPADVEQVLFMPASEHSDGIQKIRKLCEKARIPIEVNKKIIERLTFSGNCYALGIFKKYKSSLNPKSPHVVLVNPDDAGNLGTILRTMLGFGHHDLAIIRPAVDAFDPKVVRASMGSIFAQRIAYFDSIDTYIAQFDHHLYSFVLDTTNRLGETKFLTNYSLVFGNEGAGLPEDYKKRGTAVRIEQTGQIDSLNLAISVSLALYKAFITNKT